MKQFILGLCLVVNLSTTAQVTSTQLKATIDANITNRTAANKITPAIHGATEKAIVDFAVQENTTQNTVIAGKAPLASPAFSGVPTVPNATAGTTTAQVANTKFVADAVALIPNPALPSTVNTIAVETGNSNTLSLAAAFNQVLFNDSTNPIVKLPTTTYVGQSLYAYAQGNGRIGDPSGNINIYTTYGNSSTTSYNIYNGDFLKFTRVAGNDVAYLVENVSLDQTRPYLVWTGRITQTGTAVPTVNLQENTLRNAIVWSRTGTGVYIGTFNGGYALFNAQKTFFANNSIVIFSDGTTATSARASRVTDTTIKLETFSNGTPADGILTSFSFEVRVYRDFVY